MVARKLAARAVVTEGAPYRHLPSNGAAALELFARLMNVYAARVRAVVDAHAPVEPQLRGIVRVSLAWCRAEPDALTLVLLGRPIFTAEPSDIIDYPIDAIEPLIREGQAEGSIRDGQPNLLAAIFLGCLLRPLIVSRFAQPGSLDMLHDTQHDSVIAAAACAAVAQPAS